jgi:hypothetical protein
MEKKHYQAAQYILILLFMAFFVYVVSWRCEPTLAGTILCGPKVVALSLWFVVSLMLLKITHARLKKSTDAREASLFWLVNIIIICLDVAAFAIVFVLNYL